MNRLMIIIRLSIPLESNSGFPSQGSHLSYIYLVEVRCRVYHKSKIYKFTEILKFLFNKIKRSSLTVVIQNFFRTDFNDFSVIDEYKDSYHQILYYLSF